MKRYREIIGTRNRQEIGKMEKGDKRCYAKHKTKHRKNVLEKKN